MKYEHPPISDLIRDPSLNTQSTVQLDTKVGTDQLIFSVKSYLAIFQSHTTQNLKERELKYLLSRISLFAFPEALSGRDIVFGFENAGVFPRNARRIMDNLHKNPDRSKRDIEEFQRVLEKDAEADPEQGYVFLTFQLFLKLRELLKGAQTVSAFVERGYSKSISRFMGYHESMISSNTSPEEKYQASINFISEIFIRDLIFAGQILEKHNEKNKPALITFRGTAHIGLLPALHTLSVGEYPKIDLEAPYILEVPECIGVLLPILWNQEFWQEICRESMMTIKSTKMDNKLTKVSTVLSDTLDNGPWRDYLQAQFSNGPLSQRDEVITLTQNLSK